MATNSTLVDLSNQLADAVATAAKALVTLKGRARQPASGVVYAEGLVLTANHVVERDEDLSIEDGDGKSIPVQLVGRDPGSDLAVLKATGLKLKPANAASGAARVGQIILAVGRPSNH